LLVACLIVGSMVQYAARMIVLFGCSLYFLKVISTDSLWTLDKIATSSLSFVRVSVNRKSKGTQASQKQVKSKSKSKSGSLVWRMTPSRRYAFQQCHRSVRIVCAHHWL
jgi:hypothetical protein